MGILKELGIWGTNEQQQQQNLKEGEIFHFQSEPLKESTETEMGSGKYLVW